MTDAELDAIRARDAFDRAERSLGDALAAVYRARLELVAAEAEAAVQLDRTRCVDAVVRLVTPGPDRLLSRLIDAIRGVD